MKSIVEFINEAKLSYVIYQNKSTGEWKMTDEENYKNKKHNVRKYIAYKDQTLDNIKTLDDAINYRAQMSKRGFDILIIS